MSQTDMVVADQDGASFLVDINAHLAAIVSNYSGATEPATMYAYMFWADTSAGVLKQRNAANSAWISKGLIANTQFGVEGGTFTGKVNFSTGANIASATIVDLTAATGNTVHITGTVATSAVTMTSGQWMRVIADGAWPLTYHATTNRISGGADITLAAGDTVDYFYDGTTVIGNITKKNGTAVVASASVTAASDAEYIAGTDTVKFLNSAVARTNNVVIGTEIATTSGTTHDFTAIPAWVKEIHVLLKACSTNGTSLPIIQLGDSGGFETTGYAGSITLFAASTLATSNLAGSGFPITQNAATGSTYTGHIILSLSNATTNTWIASTIIGQEDTTRTDVGGGSKSLSATLTSIRLTTTNGTDAFDAGTVNIHYQ